MFSRIRESLHQEKGIFDLGSVMTGVVVTGILGAVAAATLLGVIPWFQDKTAQDDINVMKIAEDSHYNDKSVYGDINALYTGRYLNKTLAPSCITVTSTGYTMYVKSKSGKMFSQTSSDAKSTVVTSIPCTLR
jgi:hypothetical protein